MTNCLNQPCPDIIALDFDGVLCDGLAEYFQASQRCYHQLWPSMHPQGLDDYAQAFYRLRPIIETGWEMTLLLRALVLGHSEAEIQGHWPELVSQLLTQEQLDRQQLIQTLDQVRDQWIAENLPDWLDHHHFYPGIIGPLKTWLAQGQPQVYVISTKEGRFIQALLAQKGINLPSQQIIGKEIKQAKALTLGQILQRHACPPEKLWFVEDRLPTLQAITQRSELKGLQLFLADWGYNTPQEHQQAQRDARLHLLTLVQWPEPWTNWLSPTMEP
ncbi:HAD family hydrolase [Synechocystis sp. LKSZ1]|uniref:HAD family hydrolase n=1 Tax=Synechocystis sp. LKSZ1 TaxID=3144951 RepID=UPI00336BD907